MNVKFENYEIKNTTEKYVRNIIRKQYSVQDFQIIFTDNEIELTNKLGEPFAYIATWN